MEKNLQNLVKQLDRKRVSDSLAVEFVKLGQPAFDYLYEAIEKRKLSGKQIQHAFSLLFNLTREACFGEQDRLLQLVLAWIHEEEPDIRGTAAIIAVRLTELGEHFPQLRIADWTTVAPILKSALDQGLPEPSRSYVQSALLNRVGVAQQQIAQQQSDWLWKKVKMENNNLKHNRHCSLLIEDGK